MNLTWKQYTTNSEPQQLLILLSLVKPLKASSPSPPTRHSVYNLASTLKKMRLVKVPSCWMPSATACINNTCGTTAEVPDMQLLSRFCYKMILKTLNNLIQIYLSKRVLGPKRDEDGDNEKFHSLYCIVLYCIQINY